MPAHQTPLSDWTPASIGDLTGKTALVTGANSGLGLVTARLLAEAGAQVIMAGRNADRLSGAVTELGRSMPAMQLETQLLDLASLSSVRTAAEEIRSKHQRLDLVVNNAGIMATPKATTADGFDEQFATNHLGHFALTGLLLPLLEAAAGRVVPVSSIAAQKGSIRFDDINHAESYDPWTMYRQTKLANLMFGREFAKRTKAAGSSVTAAIAHPGVSATNLAQGMGSGSIFDKIQAAAFSALGQSPELGALPQVCASTGPVNSGEFVGPNGFKEFRGSGVALASVPAAAQNDADCARLWVQSEELTGVSYL